MPGAQVASGRVVEVIPERRLVFTWGWEGARSPVPPGSTTVVIEQEPDGAGTLLRLTHTDLAPPQVAEHHREGWERYLERLECAHRAANPDPTRPRWKRVRQHPVDSWGIRQRFGGRVRTKAVAFSTQPRNAAPRSPSGAM